MISYQHFQTLTLIGSFSFLLLFEELLETLRWLFFVTTTHQKC